MSTQLTDVEFRDLLERALPDPAADGALAPRVAADVAAGRRRLGRRRRGVATGVLVAAVVVGAALVAVPGDDAAAPGPAVTPPTSAEGRLEACRTGNNSARAVDLVFGGRAPVVKAVAETPHQVVLALESADGSHWASCSIRAGRSEFRSGMEVHRARGTATGFLSSSATGCPLVDGEVDPGCTRFTVSVVDRLPPAVAAVSFRTADDVETTVETVDGFVVLNHLGTLPGGAEGELPMGFPALQQVTYLDATGEPLAAQDMDGGGDGPDGEQVGDLPLLRAYPSLRGRTTY